MPISLAYCNARRTQAAFALEPYSRDPVRSAYASKLHKMDVRVVPTHAALHEDDAGYMRLEGLLQLGGAPALLDSDCCCPERPELSALLPSPAARLHGRNTPLAYA